MRAYPLPDTRRVDPASPHLIAKAATRQAGRCAKADLSRLAPQPGANRLLRQETQKRLVERLRRFKMPEMADAVEHLHFRVRHARRQSLREIGVLAHFGAQFGRRER